MAHAAWGVDCGRATDAGESAAAGADAALFDALASECRNLYGKRLVSLAVYGSYARGDQRSSSDVDSLVVADAYPPDISHRARESATVRALLPPGLAGEAEDLGVISARLREQRERSFYGDTDFIPSMNYHRPQAEQAMNEADRALEFFRRLIEGDILPAQA